MLEESDIPSRRATVGSFADLSIFNLKVPCDIRSQCLFFRFMKLLCNRCYFRLRDSSFVIVNLTLLSCHRDVTDIYVYIDMHVTIKLVVCRPSGLSP